MNFNIVELIENNPIVKFNTSFKNKLIETIESNFTNYEQQLFLSSFYCYLKYDSNNDYVIDLDEVWKWIGFSQKVKAKILLEKYFIIDIDYKKSLLSDKTQLNHIKGGQNKEIFMLNINTFKSFCLKAGTDKAHEIHNYYIKLEKIIFKITQEQCQELTLQLKQSDINNTELQQQLIKQTELDKEKFLLKEYGTIGSIFYIIKVKTNENGTYIIKVGESRKGVINRYREHRSNYEECLLLDCFKVDKSKDFESFIKYHEKINPNKVSNLQDHETETELFLIGKDLTYQNLLKIINDNIQKYNHNLSDVLLENELLKYKIECMENNTTNNMNNRTNQDNELIKELIHTNSILVNKITLLEKTTQEILNKLNNTQQSKLTTGFNEQSPHIGPRLQKINPETMLLIKVYETVTEAMNENKNIKRTSIMKAIQENTIYCGFRWLLVERNLDPKIIYDFQPTKITKVQNLGYIAKLDKDKTEILNVYLDRKTAARLNDYGSESSLDNHVRCQTLTNGNYYMLYQNCDEDLINNFEDKHGKPLLYKCGIGQFDLDYNLLSEFINKSDCIKSLKDISEKTLNKALNYKLPYNNHYYKELPEKLSIL